MILILAVTLLTILFMCFWSWRSFRDPFHPAMFLGPLLGYSYVLEPYLVSDVAVDWFRSAEDIQMVLWLNCACMAALAMGIVYGGKFQVQQLNNTRMFSSSSLIQVALLLSVVGLSAFTLGIMNAGGFETAYSRHKGGGRYSSGFIGEAINLGLISTLLIGIAQWRQGLRIQHVILVVLGVLPNLVQGTFGGRRGPLFLSLGVCLLVSILTAKRRPKVATMIAGVIVIGCAVLFMWSQRQTLHLGSGSYSLNLDRLRNLALAEDVDQGNNFIYGTGLVITTTHVGEYTYGKKLFVNVLIRPIPRFLWPNKYRDVGADWITANNPGFSGFLENQWFDAVGWVPMSGASAGSISDVYGEFGWFSAILFFVLGRGFAVVYERHLRLGGLWTALMLESTVLSIYLATQSFSAFYHRFLLLAIPTSLAWHLLVKRRRHLGLISSHAGQSRPDTGSAA